MQGTPLADGVLPRGPWTQRQTPGQGAGAQSGDASLQSLLPLSVCLSYMQKESLDLGLRTGPEGSGAKMPRSQGVKENAGMGLDHPFESLFSGSL